MHRLIIVVFLVLACDKTDKEEGIPVKDYCEKMLTLDDKTAKENGAKNDGAPPREVLASFCRGLFKNAKSKEPEAYACMANCMMDAESRSDEQACTAKKKCLEKAKNPKLFSNRKD